MPDHPFIARSILRLDALVSAAAHGRDPAQSGLLIALSGGPDSVALLIAAHAWAGRRGAVLEAAHLNHRLRGAEADGDEAFCRELCARLAVPLHVRRADPRPLARRRGRGCEEAGRVVRRRFLAQLLRERPRLTCVATGHHRDDQAETVVMRLFRGGGPDGLCGMRPLAGRVIHPLLDVPRREILAFLEAAGQPWRLDATNETGAATRTRVRRELLPLARDIFGAGAGEGPIRAAALLGDDAALLDDMARAALPTVIAPDGDALLTSALTGLARPLARRTVRLFLAERHGVRRDLGRAHVEALLDWLGGGGSGGSLDLPGGWTARREFERVAFARGAPVAPPGARQLRLRVVPSDAQPPAEATPAWRLSLPARALAGSPRLREWRAGDRLRLPGMGGRKKVSDLLRERRVPRSRRAAIAIVEDDAGLLWVVGLARDERTLGLPGEEPTVTLIVTARGPAPSAE